jgi:hypothetical protein|tara:strand:+ start:39 stop:1199 length:1161 start_codon:yes stop_codon:yes gene_type:complete
MSLEFDGANNKISNSSGASYGVALPAPNYRQPQPLIINGDMAVAQRATSTASITTTGYQTVDRYQTQIGSLGTWTQSQATDVPTGSGFATSLKMDCTTADASPAASDYLYLEQIFEGQNLQLLKKGTADAEKITVSFWVKSVLTGTYCVSMKDNDNNRAIAGSYTISDASTWEKKIITFAGDTTGAFGNDNGASLTLHFWLAAGSDYTSGSLGTSWATTVWANMAVGQVNLANSTSNDFWITGVQMEVGEFTSSTIPPFQHESYGENLQRCQRYYQKSFDIGTAPAQNVGIQTGELSFPSTKGASASTTLSQKYNFPVRMRASPAMTGYNSAASNAEVRDVTASADCSSTAFASNKETGFYVTCTSSGTTSVGNYLSLHFTAAAEL